MTRLGRTLLALHLAGFCWLAYVAAVCVQHRSWPEATAFYATAVVLALSAGREIRHEADAQADAIRAGRPRPGTTRSDAKAIVRAELAGTCQCERWWTTIGTDHDPHCPQQTRTNGT
ncbi:hypothetical protein ACGFR8_07710 [Streptomyces brevispora]|uniref:hypothetical protein n=1 Tax=Streptomyces brevispora TaxID=887462 RepID=UPI003711E21E